MKVYGPYKRKDGREHIIKYVDGKRTTQSYPRYLMEQRLGRALNKTETVDHINGNFTDHRVENLQLLSLGDNIRKAVPPKKLLEFNCPVCALSFKREARYYRHNQLKQGKSGPYCSKRCAGLSQGQRKSA